MGLLETLQKQSPKTSRVHDAEPSSGYVVYRTSTYKVFNLTLNIDKEAFEKLIDEIDYSEIIHIQFTLDLKSVVIVYVTKFRKLNKADHDANLPIKEESDHQIPDERYSILTDQKLHDESPIESINPQSKPYEGIKL